MKRMFAVWPLAAFAAFAQDNGIAQFKQQFLDLAGGNVVATMGLQGAVMGPTVKGAPYSALETIQNTQTLVDGTNINRTTQTMVYRDSEGRMRRETPDLITIWDPVANVSYSLDPKTQTARKMPLGLAAGGPVFSAQPGGNMRFVYRAGGQATASAPPMPQPLAGNGSIGVSYSPSDSEQARAALKANGLTEGVFVQNVAPGSPAEKAGIESGDVITGINGKSIRDGNDLTTAVSGTAPGATASVSAMRDGKLQTLQAVVADRSKVFPQPGNMTFFANRLAPGSLPTLLSVQGKMTAKTESLGQQTIEGVNVEGTRMTSTIEAGEIGNDRPIQILTERWYSHDLETAVRMTHSDPRTGQETLQLTNISRVDPSPDLFQVPASYQTVGAK